MGAGKARSADEDAIVVREAARANERDRYLAALLAPRSSRADLIVLSAFLGEVARISSAVNEPMMGEIRLQWWCDAIVNRGSGEPTGNPVADALNEVIDRRHLSQEAFLTILDARARELQAEPFASLQELERYLDETDGIAFRLAAKVLGNDEAPPGPALLTAAGQAYGRVGLLRLLPVLLAKGRNPLAFTDKALLDPTGAVDADADWSGAALILIDSAHTWLGEARQLAAGAPKALKPAILPLALVEPYLAALEGLGPDIARAKADISPLARVWRLWRASRLGRI